MQYNDPTALTIRLDELDGAIVAIRKVGVGNAVRRRMSDGKKATRVPYLCELQVYRGKSEDAEQHTTLVFPETLQSAIDAHPDGQLGRLTVVPHPNGKTGWTMWQLEPVSAGKRAKVVEKLSELNS
jgi:hypothetical protein